MLCLVQEQVEVNLCTSGDVGCEGITLGVSLAGCHGDDVGGPGTQMGQDNMGMLELHRLKAALAWQDETHTEASIESGTVNSHGMRGFDIEVGNTE